MKDTTDKKSEGDKNLEKRLEAKSAELEKVKKELHDFAYIISHDLRAPLRGINQLVDWISSDYSKSFDEDGQELVQLLHRRVKRMENLIDGVLSYSRAGRLREGEKEEDVDLNELVPEVISSLSPPDDIEITVAENMPTVYANKTKMEQVFSHLIQNGIQYMDKEQGKIKVGVNDKGTHWEFFVTDNGPGIAEKHFDQIFKIFATLQSKDVQETAGVGLSVVKKIAEFYEGDVRIDSEVGQGATFFVTIKKKQKEKQE